MSKKKLICAALAAAMCSGAVLSGCTGGTTQLSPSSQAAEGSTAVSAAPTGAALTLPEDGGFKTVTAYASEDKYRTFYEIFPYSFYDSDGSGIGDLKGITQHLDYLNDGDINTTDDLGIEGIWLMPIMPSGSYHKYNVKDYMAIDESYGTMDDMRELTEECHKRNIRIIIDLVLNHTSRKHEWFTKAVEELKAGKTDGYAEYYHMAEYKEDNPPSGWRRLTGVDGKWYYEAQFDTDMPDLNLKNPAVREEIKKIVDFWLKDVGIDGFRLDAVLWFESTGIEDSVEDLKFLYDYAKSVKDDVYMVGECWSGAGDIAQFYDSGADSFFNFGMQSATGNVNVSINTKDGKGYTEYLANWQKTLREHNPDAIDTPFISNHDTDRSAGFLSTNTTRKMAAAMYILAPGDSFVYYGEEIGMRGSGSDPDKRTGMYWSSTDSTGYVTSIPGATNKETPEKGALEQAKDDSSLQSFYRRVIRLKSQNPEIARGTIEAVDLGDSEVGAYISEYNDSKVMVIFNVSSEGKTVTIPADKFTAAEVRGYLKCDSGDAPSGGAAADPFADLVGGGSEETQESAGATVTDFAVTGSSVSMPAYSAIVLK